MGFPLSPAFESSAMKKASQYLAFAVGVYVISYYVILLFTDRLTLFTGAWKPGKINQPLSTQIESPVLQAVYHPVYWIDTRLRPSYWTYEIHPIPEDGVSVSSVEFMRELDPPDAE